MCKFGRYLWLFCGVHVQPRSDVWTTAVEGRGKISGGKGVTARSKVPSAVKPTVSHSDAAGTLM